MFGSYSIPFEKTINELTISASKEGGLCHYKRVGAGVTVEKTLVTGRNELFISPVEPVHLPKEITPYFMVEFQNQIMVEPKGSVSVFLKYPIEMGVFVNIDKDFQIVDIFSFVKQKYTFYGEPKTGVVCRYCSSEAYHQAPEVNPVFEGVIQLEISNTTSSWIDIKKVVFNSYWMQIFHDETLVFMKAYMKVTNRNTAETDFIDSPLRSGMTKAIDLLISRKIAMISTRFLMAEGL
jgi:uncharacterized protein